MIYKKRKTSAISFPLGGIGAGCIGIAGNGVLKDWEIFNAPSKGSYNGLSHFAVRAEKDGEVKDFRVLNGDLAPHYIGQYSFEEAHIGYGYGPEMPTLCNLPHFREHSFDGTYPVCRLEFGKEKFPGKCALTAWSVLIPGESLPSSLPAAFFEVEIENNTDEELIYTAAGIIGNPWSTSNLESFNRYGNNSLTCFSGDETGDITLTVDPDGSVVSHQTYLYRGYCRDQLETYCRDTFAGGDFKERFYETKENLRSDNGLLAARFALKPGEKKVTRFVISWSIPVRSMNESEERRKLAEKYHVSWTWKNFYASCWKNSQDSANYAVKNFDELRRKTFCFRDALFSGSLPEFLKAGIAANLAVLKSPTCLRLEDGTFYSWEGVSTRFGSCEGSCAHVLNYAQALAFLFPDLERSMRASHLKYSVDKNGASKFRLILPLGIRAEEQTFRPCADGQFGDVMKIYRDWKIGGDDEYIRHYWPTVKKTVEYAWSKENPDRWDPEQSGVLTGRQHHTLDMELFGPNSWLTGHYLGGLLAAAELADFMGDTAFAEKCRNIFRKGEKFVNDQLFNGEYFAQIVDLNDLKLLESFGAEIYWSAEHGEIKYQVADGCGIDAVLAQNYADIYGLGRIFEDKKYLKTLQSIYKYNFKKSMREFTNTWRVYSLNDEAGTVICTWPRGSKPAIPLTYNSETMTGFEWAFASALASRGLTKKALTVARAIRDRFDGEKRNPFDEFECGSNYARSLASYGLLPALSGFEYDVRNGMLGFSPKLPGAFQTFWALGEAWGTFYQDETKAVITLLHGSFTLRTLKLDPRYDVSSLPVSLKAGESLEFKSR